MKLAIFDIDGTLCQTSAADDRCFTRALTEIVGATNISTDWGSYEHSTDVGIASQIIRETHRTRAIEPLLTQTHDRFIELLKALSETEPALFTPTPGAAHMLTQLVNLGWTTAIATGAWKASATIKLRACGLFDPTIPAAFANDSLSREGIILTAATRAGISQQDTLRIVYIGDGLWDLRAARNLGIGFIGLAQGDRAEQLAREGAATIYPKFVNTNGFAASLESATIPR